MNRQIIHETDYLKVTKEKETIPHSQGDYEVDKYDVEFLGHKTTHHGYNEASIQKVILKRTKAYDLVPQGAKIIPKQLIGMCKGLLVGGILEDSLYAVYGLCEGKLNSAGISGYSCSIFWFPTDEELKSFTDFDSLVSDFRIKQ